MPQVNISEDVLYGSTQKVQIFDGREGMLLHPRTADMLHRYLRKDVLECVEFPDNELPILRSPFPNIPLSALLRYWQIGSLPLPSGVEDARQLTAFRWALIMNDEEGRLKERMIFEMIQ